MIHQATDHIKAWCRGGDHSEDNLTLRCRRHNQAAAEQELGTGFMAQARKHAQKILLPQGRKPRLK